MDLAGVPESEAGFGIEVDILESDFADRFFREADDESGAARAAGGEVDDLDVVIIGGGAGDGLGGVSVGNLRIIAGEVDGDGDVGHGEVAIDEVLDVAAAFAGSLDADTAGGAIERAIGDEKIFDAAAGFAADGEAVTAQEGAIGDDEILAGKIA